MDGITVLYTYTYSSGEASRVLGIILGAIMCLIFIVSTFVMLVISGDKRGGLITGLLALLGLAVFIFCSNIKPVFWERYEVIIDDSVSLSEFNEKYNIVKVRGEIYTIEERVD